jgi:hypothetical protein
VDALRSAFVFPISRLTRVPSGRPLQASESAMPSEESYTAAAEPATVPCSEFNFCVLDRAGMRLPLNRACPDRRSRAVIAGNLLSKQCVVVLRFSRAGTLSPSLSAPTTNGRALDRGLWMCPRDSLLRG